MFISFYFVFGFIAGVYVAQEYNVPNVKVTFEKIRSFVNETNLNSKLKEFEKTMSKNKSKNNTIEVEGEDTETGSELDLELSEEEEEEEEPDETSVKKMR
jgi:hypothetical protein